MQFLAATHYSKWASLELRARRGHDWTVRRRWLFGGLTRGGAVELLPTDILDIDKFWVENLLEIMTQFIFVAQLHSNEGSMDAAELMVIRTAEYKGKRLLKLFLCLILMGSELNLDSDIRESTSGLDIRAMEQNSGCRNRCKLRVIDFAMMV